MLEGEFPHLASLPTHRKSSGRVLGQHDDRHIGLKVQDAGPVLLLILGNGVVGGLLPLGTGTLRLDGLVRRGRAGREGGKGGEGGGEGESEGRRVGGRHVVWCVVMDESVGRVVELWRRWCVCVCVCVCDE